MSLTFTVTGYNPEGEKIIEPAEVTIDKREEELLWKQVADLLPDVTGEGTIYIENKDSQMERAEILVCRENGSFSFRLGYHNIRLGRSLYGVKKLRRIDPETGSHAMWDLIPNNMGTMTLDVGGRYGQTGGKNAGADLVEGAYVLKSPMPSCMFWVKYQELRLRGYEDYTDMMYDEDEEFKVLDSMFNKDLPAPESGEDMTAARLYEYLSAKARQVLSGELAVEFLSNKVPWTRRQVESAKKIQKSFENCLTVDEVNKKICDLIAVTNISFKEGRTSKTVASFMVPAVKDPKKQKDLIAESVNFWESMVNAMEAVLPPKVEKDVKRVSPFGGIEITLASEEELNGFLKKFRAPTDSYSYRLLKVDDPKKKQRISEYAEKRKITKFEMLVHGSRTENWCSIIQNGLLLNPNAVITGKAYGYGSYTARDFQKSLGYTNYHGSKWAGGNDEVGIMGIFNCAYGTPYFPKGWGEDHEKRVKEGGYDCLDAKAEYSGYRMDEIVFYDEAATCLEYLLLFADDEKALPV